MAENWRSHLITAGNARLPNRAMLRAVGFKDGDFDKPLAFCLAQFVRRFASGERHPPPNSWHPRRGTFEHRPDRAEGTP